MLAHLFAFLGLVFACTPAFARDKTVIAVVGGTTFGYPPDFAKGLAEDEGSFTVETNVGESPPIYRMRYKGVPFYYIRAHGRTPNKRSKVIAPTGDEYVKTWVALHQLGVQYALGGATAGAIDPGYDFDDFVIVDDFILMGNQRPQSVLAESGIVRDNLFASFAVPFCPDLRRLLIEESRKTYQGRVHTSGVVVQDDPMRFETPAEIRMMRGMERGLGYLGESREYTRTRMRGGPSRDHEVSRRDTSDRRAVAS